MEYLFALLFLVALVAALIIVIMGGLSLAQKLATKMDWNTARKSLLIFTLALFGVFITAGCAVDASGYENVTTQSGSSSQVESELSSKAKDESESKAKAASESKQRAESESIAEADSKAAKEYQLQQSTPQSVPSGETHIVVNNNTPYFSNEDIAATEAYEKYGTLDALGRVTAANAVLGVELMPAEERGDISSVKPTGWNQAKYANVSNGWLYNRAHLIGHQLTGEDANDNNLMTGTRWFNVEGMLPFENFVANYIETTENHVRYRVTPVFEGNNLLASGAYMEGFSIEDNGEGIKFNIYVPNRQPGVEINYADGSSVGPEGPLEEDTLSKLPSSNNQTEPAPGEETYEPAAPDAPETAPTSFGGDVSAVDANGNGTVTIQEAKDAGFSMPIYSDHWLYPYMIDRNSNGMVGE